MLPASSVTSCNFTLGLEVVNLKPVAELQVASPNVWSYWIKVLTDGSIAPAVVATLAKISASAAALTIISRVGVSPIPSLPSVVPPSPMLTPR